EFSRQAIYTSISEPRRRLMHLKIAKILHQAPNGIDAAALDIAHHAATGGDAGIAAEACVAAARRCVRLFAHGDALALAHKGQHYAENLAEPVRTERMIELTEIEIGVSRPQDIRSLVSRVEALAETALDHGRADLARRCYSMLASIRWQGGA